MSNADPTPPRKRNAAVPFSVVEDARRRALADELGPEMPELATTARNPLLVARERDGWKRLSDECSSALAIMGSPTALGVTSCLRGEGRTTVALAAALAQSRNFGRKTICVDFDLEKPSLAKTLGAKGTVGVADFIRGELPLEACIQWVSSDLGVLGAGTVGRNAPREASRLIQSQLMEGIREHCEAVVVDLPPFVGAGVSLARLCPNVVMVVRTGAVSLEQVRRAAAELNHPPVILNGADAAGPGWIRNLTRGR
ncbi:MAG: polysaccharide biosynthesis transport protein [Actinomycetota bacterium]|nr:polysaccharide biosynthesis transport protein [Actinomycetota bacterium]